MYISYYTYILIFYFDINIMDYLFEKSRIIYCEISVSFLWSCSFPPGVAAESVQFIDFPQPAGLRVVSLKLQPQLSFLPSTLLLCSAQGKQSFRRIVRCLEEELQCIAKFSRQGSQDNKTFFTTLEVASSECLCVGLLSLNNWTITLTGGKILSSR